MDIGESASYPAGVGRVKCEFGRSGGSGVRGGGAPPRGPPPSTLPFQEQDLAADNNAWQRQLDYARQTLTLQPKVPEYRAAPAQALRNLATYELAQNHLDQAEAVLDEGIKEVRWAQERMPQNVQIYSNYRQQISKYMTVKCLRHDQEGVLELSELLVSLRPDDAEALVYATAALARCQQTVAQNVHGRFSAAEHVIAGEVTGNALWISCSKRRCSDSKSLPPCS